MGILTTVLNNSTKLFLRDLDSSTPRGFNLLFGGFPTASGKQVGQKASIGLSAVYHAVDLISQDYASLNTVIFQPKGNEREILTDHNAYRLLNFKPNYYQTPLEFKRMMAVNRLMYGNAYAIKKYIGSEIDELLPVHPNNVKDIIELEGELFYTIRGVELPIPGRDMIHVKDLSIEEDSFKGKSRIEYCREDIGRMLAISEFSSGFFGNGAHMGVIVKSQEGFIEDDDQRKSLENSLRENYTGSDKAYKSLVLPSGYELSAGPNTLNQRDSQFIETKIQTVEEVAQIFNLPLNKMRTKENGASYNSQEQSNIEYITDTLRPFSIAFQQEYNLKLFNSTDSGHVFTRDSLEDRLKGDMKTQTEHIDKMVSLGIYNRDEARHFLGKNNIEGGLGKKYYIQSNQMELGQDPIKQKDGK